MLGDGLRVYPNNLFNFRPISGLSGHTLGVTIKQIKTVVKLMPKLADKYIHSSFLPGFAMGGALGGLTRLRRTTWK